jgi:hypothetical protein
MLPNRPPRIQFIRIGPSFLPTFSSWQHPCGPVSLLPGLWRANLAGTMFAHGRSFEATPGMTAMAEDEKTTNDEQNKNTGAEEKPVDQKTQEDAAKEREKTGGYQ